MGTEWKVGDPVHVVSTVSREPTRYDFVVFKVGRKWVEYAWHGHDYAAGRFQKATGEGERVRAYRTAAEYEAARRRGEWMQQARRRLASDAYRLDFDTLDKIAAALGWDRYGGDAHG